MCRACRTYLHQMKLTIDAVGRLPEEPDDPKTHEELMRRFRSWKAD